MDSITFRLNEAEGRLEEARTARAVALLDGSPMPKTDVDALEREIEDLRSAEYQRVLRDRSIAEEAAREVRARQWARAETARVKRLAFIEAAQTAGEAMAAAFRGVVEEGDTYRDAMRALGENIPPGLEAGTERKRLSWYVGDILTGITHEPHRTRFGEIHLTRGPYPDARPARWSEHEASFNDTGE